MAAPVLTPTAQELLKAWEAWDAHPGSDTNRLEELVQRMASEAGLTGNELRKTMADGRRAGRARIRILEDLCRK